MKAPSRRGLLGSVAALAPLAAAGAMVAPAAASSVHPDADLIAACQAMIAAQAAYNAVWDGPDAIEDDDLATAAAAPFVAQWDVLLDELERLHAATAAGVVARVQALSVHAGARQHSFDHPETMTGRMLDYLLRDAAALPAGVLT